MDSVLDYLTPEPTYSINSFLESGEQTHALICNFLYYQAQVTTSPKKFPSANYVNYFKVMHSPPHQHTHYWKH